MNPRSGESFDQLIGGRIRDMRQRLGMSQTQLGDALHIGRSAVGNIELGRRQLAADELINLALYTNMPIADLIDGDVRAIPLRTLTVNAISQFYLDHVTRIDDTPHLPHGQIRPAPPLPWPIPAEQTTTYPAQMLRLLQRRLSGEELPDQLTGQLEDWLERLAADHVVVALGPDGFAYVSDRYRSSADLPVAEHWPPQ